jgi:hypothetical protein
VQRPQGPLHGQASRLLAQEKQGHLGSYIPNSFRSALLENKTKLKKPKTNLPPSHGRPPRQPGMKGVGRRGGRWGLKEEVKHGGCDALREREPVAVDPEVLCVDVVVRISPPWNN